MNILDYLEWRGDITFQERGLNEVDNLIFSTLIYLRMDGLISADLSQMLSLQALFRHCRDAGMDTSNTACDPMRLLEKAAQTARFAPVRVCCYESLFDTEKSLQFAAATFQYAPGKSYIAFRGTDSTLAGWREDCNFSYLTSTPGQIAAAEYINRISQTTEDAFIVGGHSKGGNFAAYAAAFCEENVRENRIRKIYSNDGPGFNSEIVRTPGYAAILKKFEKIIPEASLVGILLSSNAKRTVITSSARGIGQHNPYSWNVLGSMFLRADNRDFASLLLDQTLSAWISSLDAREKQQLIDAFFSPLEETGAETVQDVKSKISISALAFLKAILQMPAEKRKEISGTIGRLFVAGKDVVWKETEKSFPLF